MYKVCEGRSDELILFFFIFSVEIMQKKEGMEFSYGLKSTLAQVKL